MALVIKSMLILFMLVGLPFVLYGAWKLYGSLRETSSPTDNDERPRVHYVLSVRFLLILAVGLAFILIPVLIWNVVVPSLDTPEGVELTSQFENEIGQILEWQVGPITVRQMLVGFGVFFIAVFLISAIAKLLSR